MTETTTEDVPVAPPKRNPETMVLRGRPRVAVRFRRELIITIIAIVSIILVIVIWFALRSHVHIVVTQPDDQSQPSNLSPSDTLNRLPKTYADIPKLGPPLPGDLGKPILEHERSLGLNGNSAAAEQEAEAINAQHQREVAELKTARESSVLVQRTGRDEPNNAEPSAAPPVDLSVSNAAAAAQLGSDTDHGSDAQRQKADFIADIAKDEDVNDHPLRRPPSPYLLSAGSVIAASLITGLNSDLPGLVTAQVTEPVFDSATGMTLLIPQGARLIGKYDSVVAFGQRRALIIWQRIILPDGGSVRLDNMPASDPSGYAGLADQVDFHGWEMLKGALLSTLLGAGAELQFSGNGGLIEAIRQSAQQSFSHAGDQLTSKALDIQPTITVRPGAPVRLLVDRDIILAPWHG